MVGGKGLTVMIEHNWTWFSDILSVQRERCDIESLLFVIVRVASSI